MSNILNYKDEVCKSNLQDWQPASLDEYNTVKKIPIFLIKLWNILNNSDLDHIIKWDESGMSFHICKRYIFSKEVLPKYFKHNNLNSFIRQLNMYGFRKVATFDKLNTPSSENHYEFCHKYFVRNNFNLLYYIKRKISSSKYSQQVAKNEILYGDVEQFNKSLIEEIKQIREKQLKTDMNMIALRKQNENIWKEINGFRTKYKSQHDNIKNLCEITTLIGRDIVEPKKILTNNILAIEKRNLE
uniref:HSF_DOMAIN domain-containing protein n=1 Tax=Parastrongyloides trichosuri TaxID=131310 RepID=A0A0N4ZN56_PARTI